MTVISEPVDDIAGVDDNSEITFWIPTPRQSVSGNGLITGRLVRVRPSGGVLTTPSLEPGPAMTRVGGVSYPITIPASGTPKLSTLLQVSIPYTPPVVSEAQAAAAAAAASAAAAATSAQRLDTALAGADPAFDTFLKVSNKLGSTDGALAALGATIAAKYTKPSGGVPKTDLASGVQTSLDKADTTATQLANGTAGQVLTRIGTSGYGWADPQSSGSAAYDGGTEF